MEGIGEMTGVGGWSNCVARLLLVIGGLLVLPNAARAEWRNFWTMPVPARAWEAQGCEPTGLAEREGLIVQLWEAAVGAQYSILQQASGAKAQAELSVDQESWRRDAAAEASRRTGGSAAEGMTRAQRESYLKRLRARLAELEQRSVGPTDESWATRPEFRVTEVPAAEMEAELRRGRGLGDGDVYRGAMILWDAELERVCLRLAARLDERGRALLLDEQELYLEEAHGGLEMSGSAADEDRVSAMAVYVEKVRDRIEMLERRSAKREVPPTATKKTKE